MITNWNRFASAIVLAGGIIVGGCNTVQPPNQQFSDAQITTEVKTKLADVRASSIVNIHVSATNSVVTLSGAVESDDVRNKTESVTRSVPGVAKVNDDLQVVPPASAAR